MSTPTTTPHKTLCRICTAQCPIVVEVDAEGRPISARGDRDHPHSEGFFCLKGKHFPEMHTAPGRLRHCQVRNDRGELEAIDAEQAMDEVATKLQAILDEHGRNAVAVYTGTLFYQLPQTAAVATAWMDALRIRLRFSSGTIDQPGKQTAAAAHGHWLAGSHVFDECDTWMLVGTNPLVAISGGVPHANPARRLKRAQARGMSLIVIDPRRTETARQATLHLQPKPGTDPALLAGILREVIRQDLVDHDFVRAHVDGFQTLREAVERFTPEVVSARADVPTEQIVEAARLFGNAERGSVTAGTGANMSGWSNITEYLVLCLNSLCGRFRRAGDRVANPGVLTTRRAFKAQPIAPYPIDGFGKPLRARPDIPPAVCGLPTSGLADEILLGDEGRIRALITIGGNPMRAWPDQKKTRAALESLDLHVCVEPRRTESAQLAHYVLAPLLPLETPGCSLSTENLFTVSPALGYTQRYGEYAPAVASPPAGSDLREDWEYFYGLAQRMGLPLEVAAGVFPIMGVDTPRTALDMQNKPTSEEMLDFVTKGSWIPLDRLRGDPEHVLFDDEAVHVVRPADEGCEARLDVGNRVMFEELRDFSQAAIASHGGIRLSPDQSPHVEHLQLGRHRHPGAHGSLRHEPRVHASRRPRCDRREPRRPGSGALAPRRDRSRRLAGPRPASRAGLDVPLLGRRSPGRAGSPTRRREHEPAHQRRGRLRALLRHSADERSADPGRARRLRRSALSRGRRTRVPSRPEASCTS